MYLKTNLCNLRQKICITPGQNSFRAYWHPSQWPRRRISIQGFHCYCKLHGIARQSTAWYSPHQNGLAERKNRTLLEGIRSIVKGTQIPKSLWDEIARTVNYLQNRSPTKALKLLTPEEAFTRIKPHLAHLRIIGCTAYCHIPDEKRRKFDTKAISSILIGYDEQSKAYRCHDPVTRKIIVSRSVRFDETTLAFPHSEITEPLIDNFIFPEYQPDFPALEFVLVRVVGCN